MTSSQSLSIFGPNLKDQSKGQFHVHASSCGDCKHYGPGGKFGGEEAMPVEASSLRDVVEFVYGDHMAESPDTPFDVYASDFHFAPCVNQFDNDNSDGASPKEADMPTKTKRSSTSKRTRKGSSRVKQGEAKANPTNSNVRKRRNLKAEKCGLCGSKQQPLYAVVLKDGEVKIVKAREGRAPYCHDHAKRKQRIRTLKRQREAGERKGKGKAKRAAKATKVSKPKPKKQRAVKAKSKAKRVRKSTPRKVSRKRGAERTEAKAPKQTRSQRTRPAPKRKATGSAKRQAKRQARAVESADPF